MGIPGFVVELRRKIGHDLLPMTGICAVITRHGASGPEVLLVQRADCKLWTPITGIIEPGEEPDLAALREIEEETGVTARIDRLVRIQTSAHVTHGNGDRAVYLDSVFACSLMGGDPRPDADEVDDVRWWPVDDELPVVNPRFRQAIHDCVGAPRPVMFGAEGRTYS